LTNINDFENLLINLRTPNPFIKPFKTALNNLKHEIFYKIDNKMATVIDTLWSFYSLFDGRKKRDSLGIPLDVWLLEVGSNHRQTD